MSGLASTAYAAGWRIVRALPGPVATALFRLGADWAVRRNGAGVRRLTANLETVTGTSGPELAALVRAGLRSYARYWQEAFRLPSRSREQVLASFVMENEELLWAAQAEGKGLIVALPHSGNWDHAGAYICYRGMPLVTVAERLKPEDLYRRFLAYRESLGMEIIPSAGGGTPVIDQLAGRLREGRLVVLLADRDLSARGVPVEFFGRRTRMPAGPAILALRTGAPLFLASLWFDGPIAKARVSGPLEPPAEGDRTQRIAAFTQQIADQLAKGITEHPEDWHMLQRLWIDDPAGSPKSVRDPNPGAPAPAKER